jgi:hypothetical protein
MPKLEALTARTGEFGARFCLAARCTKTQMPIALATGLLFRAGKKFPMPLPRNRRRSPGPAVACLYAAATAHEAAMRRDGRGPVGRPGRSDCRAHAWMLAVRQVARPGWPFCSRPYLFGDAMLLASCHVSCPVVGARWMPVRSGSFEGRTGYVEMRCRSFVMFSVFLRLRTTPYVCERV